MKIVKTPQFEADQLHVEDHIFDSNEQEVKFVEKRRVFMDGILNKFSEL